MSKGYTEAGKRLEQQQTGRDQTQALMRQQLEHHQSFIKARMELLARWCTHGVRPDSLLRFLMLDLQQNERLRQCETGSILLGLLACAQAGLEPGALKQECFLVPFYDSKSKMYRAQWMAGYRGLIRQAKRSREVKNIRADLAYERDHFKVYGGSQPRIDHEVELGDRGHLTGAYAIAFLSHALTDPEWMALPELERIRKMAKRGEHESPAWRDHEGEMYRKSPIRRLCKRLPMGQDYLGSAAIEQAFDDDKPEAATQVIDVLTEGAATEVERGGSIGREIAQTVADRLTDEEKRAIEAQEAKGG